MRSVAALVLLAAAASCTPDRSPAPSTSPTGAGGIDLLMAPAPLPVARTEVAGAAWLGRIAVVGGLTADGAASDRVDLYDAATGRWTEAPRLPVRLHHAGVAVSRERLFVAGGFAAGPGGWVPQSAVRSLGRGDATWREEPSLGTARGGLALAAVDEQLVALGGTDAGGAVLRRVEVLPVGAARWSPGPDLAEAREHVAATSVAGRVVVLGGRQASLTSNLRSTESWDPDERAWVPGPPLQDARGGIAAAVSGGRPCVAGGEQPEGTIASVECLVDGAWRRVGTLPTPRHGLAVVGLGARLHVIGGGPTPGLSVSDAHEVVAAPG